jgi:hypothetical protein
MMPLGICTPYVIVFLVRCPDGIRTECDIHLPDSQTPARLRPLDLGRTRQTFSIRRFRPIRLLFSAPKGIGLKSNIRLSRVPIKYFSITKSDVSTHFRPD